MNEDEQAALAYLKLQDDAKKLIRDAVLDLLMSKEDPMADIVQSVVIDIIRSAIEDKPLANDSNNVNLYQRPQLKLQEAILKLVFPHRS
jgi:hypothetical protein